MAQNGDSDSNGKDDSEEVTEDAVSLSLDATLDVLSHRHRRELLDYLMEAEDNHAAFEDITDHLTKRIRERRGEQPNRGHIKTSIHHVHLPKLADAGVVEYDGRTKDVCYWPNSRLEKWHERVQESDE